MMEQAPNSSIQKHTVAALLSSSSTSLEENQLNDNKKNKQRLLPVSPCEVAPSKRAAEAQCFESLEYEDNSLPPPKRKSSKTKKPKKTKITTYKNLLRALKNNRKSSGESK